MRAARRNLGDLADRAADPDALALIDLADAGAPAEWSHGRTDAAVRAVARALLARGHLRGDRIAICSANRAEYLLAFLGIMRAGMVAVPVNWKLPRPVIEYVLRDAGVSLVFTDAERRAACPPDLAVAGLDGGGLDAFADPGPFDAVAPGPGEIAMILYTSGSTGRPKGVRLDHAGQLWAIEHRLAGTPDLARHRLLVAAPMFHMNALCVSTLQGYHNLPDKTAEVMTADGYYVTGDVMRRDADGWYYFVGRADDMFVCGGENIYPGEVERMLERHPRIRQACVVPVPDEVRGAKPVAFVVPVAGACLSAPEVKEWSLANAPAYQHPRHVEFLGALPLEGTNKVDRRALTELALRVAGGNPA